MKKLFLLTMLLSFGLFSIAQTRFQVKDNLREAKSIDIQASEKVLGQSSAIPYIKPENPAITGTDDIYVLDIGAAANAYGLYNGGRTFVWVENDINSISFTHRMLNPPEGPGSGYVAYDFSIDGGATWSVDNQVYEPPTFEYNARYPQGLIYNPLGNTDPSQAFFTYFAATGDSLYNGGGSYAWGVNVLTTIPPEPTQNHQASTPSQGFFQGIPEAFHIIPNGNTFVVEPADEDYGSYTGNLLFTNGVFNPNINDYEYTQALLPAPITNDPVDCIIAGCKIAFSPDGQTGYVAMLSNNGENTEESYGCFYPILYKSTDGGETWDEEAINVQLGGPEGLNAVLNYMSDENLAQIFEPPIPPRDEIPYSTAFDLDLVVDNYGNPHILTTVGVGSQQWSIYTSAQGEACNGWIAMLHIYSDDNGTWMADTLATPHTFRGEFGWYAGISEDNRPQISITPDGRKLFFSWIDSDQPYVIDNIYPDVFCVGYDVDHDVYTRENGNYKLWNVTHLSAAWMSAYMATQSYYVFDNGNSWEIPFVYQEMDINDPSVEVQYKYIKDFIIESNDFGNILDAQFSVDQTIIMAGTPIQFTDLSSGNPISWEWDFNNDGTIDSYSQNPEWIYSEPGVYSVLLTISDGTNEDSELKEDYITVTGGQSPILLSVTPGIEEISLEWEAIPNKTDKDNKTGHFIFNGGNPMSDKWTIYIGGATINGMDMEEGDEIGVFYGDILVGSFTLDQICTPENQFDNDIFAYSMLRNGDPGYTAGGSFTIIAWDESEQKESTSFDYVFSDPYGDAWTGDVFPDGDGQYSMAEFSFYRIYVPTFNIYYEDGTLVAGEVEGTTYTDMDLTSGQEYCYYITQILENGQESNPSNVLCATPLFENTPVLISATPGIEEISLEWEAIPSEPDKDNKTGHFIFNGGNPMSDKWTIYVGGSTINGMDMEEGDEIGVFYGDILVGSFTLDQICTPENQFDNDIFAYSMLRNGDPGYTAGGSFTIIAWDESEQKESTSFDYTFSDPYGDAWTGDVFPYDDGEYSMAEFSFYSGYIIPTFNIYYEDGTLVAGGIDGTIYTDMDLTAGQEYCYYVTQILENGQESNPSNVLCAMPLFENTPTLISATPGIEEISLEWAAIPGEPDKDNKIGHFIYQGPGSSLYIWSLYVGAATFNGINMEAGDEIGVFDGDILVGAFTLDQVCTPENQFDNDMLALCCVYNTGDTIYKPGNDFTIVAWDESTQMESTSFDYVFSDFYAGAYTGDVFPDGDGEFSLAEFLFYSSCYIPTFNICYEDGTLVAEEVEGTTYTDMDLTFAQEYCYYVTQILENGEESDASNILCAIPFLENTPVLVSAIPGIEEISLEWQSVLENDIIIQKDFENKDNHWNVTGDPSACLWPIYIEEATFDGIDLIAGDEIAIFDGDLLVGAFTLTQVCTPNNQFENELIAYSELLNGPGFTPGNPISFRAWDQSENFEYTIFEFELFGQYTGSVFPGEWPYYSMARISFFSEYPPDKFNIYYEDGTLVAGEVEGTSYTDMDLLAGQEYCYYVTQILEGGFESNPSNILCATPLFDNSPVLVSAIPDPEGISLEWEAIPENDKEPQKDFGKEKGHWNVIGHPSFAIWTIYIGDATMNGIDMEPDDEIAIFDGDLLVGVFTLTQICSSNNQFENDLKAFAMLFSGPGYTPGNPFTFIAWDQSEEIESSNFEYTFSDPYGDAYMGDVFPEGEPYSLATLNFSNGGFQNLFNIYYEDGTLVAGEVEGTTYTDVDLTAGQEYCYYVTQILEGGGESNPSNVLCATPTGYLGTMTGTITNGIYPIEGALITLDGTTYTAISGADGTYAIEDVEQGTYDATASAEGYTSQTKYDQIIMLGETTIVDFMLMGIQNYDLVPGFQFISSRFIPENHDMLVMVEEILNENLDFIRNSQGQTLRKIGPNWVNGIGDWIVDEGYLVKMYAGDSFTINGALIDPGNPIPVETGFQFVSYFPEIPIDAMIAFATIIGDDLTFIRNSQGQTLRKIGPNWVNGLGDCQPGEGYLIKMYADGVLIYPSSYSITCGDPFADPRDGQTYNTVQIGDQCWMAENLNIGEVTNGHINQTNNNIIEKYCYGTYTGSGANCDEYGGLYQWNEMMEYDTTAGIQGICPNGWHLPTDYDWTVLSDNLGGYEVAGGKMKETGTVHWQTPNTGATNESGFTALPGGHLGTNGNFYYLHESSKFWTSSLYGANSAKRRQLGYDYINFYGGFSDLEDGFSVRCLQNNSMDDNLSIKDSKRAYDLSDPKTKSNEAVNFVFEGGNPAEAVYSLYIKGLEIGDEVAAYDGDKMIGSLRINSENGFENELPVFSTLTNGQGYEEGNPITFKVWSENEIVSVYFTMEAIYDSYVSDVYPEGDGKYSVVNIFKGTYENADKAISIYPNPSDGIFNISLQGIKGNIQIKVLDIRGKKYSNFELNGATVKKLDLTKLTPGVYFISLSGKDFNVIKKIVIN